MYILDTSAIRGISAARLESGAKEVDIAISTLTVLELASHLNDSTEETGYLRTRGNLLKCLVPGIKILEDPIWSFANSNQMSAKPSRKDDKLVLKQLLSAVEKSRTQSDLDSKTLTYSDGTAASCKNVGNTLTEILKDEEREFIKHIEELAKHAKLDPLHNGKHALTSSALMDILLSGTKSLSCNFDENVRAKIFFAIAPHLGYLLHRLFLYSNRREPGQSQLTVDPNDCEDAYICLHLDFSSENILVTNDKGTLAALRGTADLLNEALPIPISIKHIVSGEEFLKIAEA